jgi:hypothetical protein
MARTYFAYWTIGADVIQVSASSQAELDRIIADAGLPEGKTFTMWSEET